MKPEYKLRYDLEGNVLFLDYTTKYGEEYHNYNYRWVWTRQNHGSLIDDWFLVSFTNHHPDALELLSEEIILAKRAYNEITNKKLPAKHDGDN